MPSGAVIVSVVGSKSRRPARASAITVSGDVTKLSVFAEPSLRFGKLRLKELTIVFGCPVMDSGRDHCPMHGPQALASTVAPIASRSASRPSRSIVARICSEPGVISSSVFAVSPLAAAWRAIEAARVMSSYDEFVHEPISADEISSGQPFSSRRRADPGADLVGAVGGVGAVDQRLELVEVDLDQLVVERAVVGAEVARRPCRRRRRSPRGRSP